MYAPENPPALAVGSVNPNFSQEELESLKLSKEIFGRLSARELSLINHTFNFWMAAYHNSLQPDGYKDKSKATVARAASIKLTSRGGLCA